MQKHFLDKSWRGQRGSPNDIRNIDLELCFQGHFKVKMIFSNKNLYFLRRIWKERKTLRIICFIGQGRLKVIWRPNRRKWVKFYWFKMWTFYRVLLRSNKFPKVGQLAKHGWPWIFEGQKLPISCATREYSHFETIEFNSFSPIWPSYHLETTLTNRTSYTWNFLLFPNPASKIEVPIRKNHFDLEMTLKKKVQGQGPWYH